MNNTNSSGDLIGSKGNQQQHKHIVQVTILMSISTVALMSNVSVLTLILAVRRLRTTGNIYLSSICLCNIMFSAIVLPLYCFLVTDDIVAITVQNFLVTISVLVYTSNITAITYDR